MIVTLRIDDGSQAFFNALREQHFPPHRNFLAAHLTLFHNLPGECLDWVANTLHILSTHQPSLVLNVTGPRQLGRGVAFRLECPPLRTLHRALQQEFHDRLGPQDRQSLSPHVTVQNKVDPQTAAALHRMLAAQFVPFEAKGVGLALWRYLGGPWEPIASFPFQIAPSPTA